MYGKFFSSTFTGSMFGAGADVFAVWGYVIANAVESTVDLNPDLLGAVLGMTPERVKIAIDFLCSPDNRSRNHDQDGRRLIQQGPFQFHVVSHKHYKGIRNEDDRREYNRRKQAESRARRQTESTPMSITVNDMSTMSTMSAHTEAEAETKSNTEGKTPPSDSGSELMLAGWIFEEACLPADNATRRVVADCIRLLVKQDGGTTQSAAEFILAAVRQGIADGDTISRFWFSDRRYLPKKTKRAKCGPDGLTYKNIPEREISEEEREETHRRLDAINRYCEWLERARRNKTLRESNWMEPPDGYTGRVLNRDGTFTEREIPA